MNKVNVKKLFFTIICTVIVSIFIGTTVLFISYIPAWINLDIVETAELSTESIKNIGKTYEEHIIPDIERESESYKKLYGEDFPAEGLEFYILTTKLEVQNIMSVYSKSLLIGLALGVIIYIVGVQNAKGKRLIVELLVGFMSLFLLITILNFGYNLIVTNMANGDTQVSASILDLKDYTIYVSYVGIAIVIYLANMIKQKIVANKLNKELNK